MPRRRLFAPVLALALAAVLAGCGDGSTGRDSAAVYRAQAAQICRDAVRRQATIPRPRAADLRAYLAKMIPLASSMTSRLRALAPPQDLQGEHRAALAAQERALARLRALVAALGSGASRRAVTNGVAELQRSGEAVGVAFRRLGVPACA